MIFDCFLDTIKTTKYGKVLDIAHEMIILLCNFIGVLQCNAMNLLIVLHWAYIEL